MSAPDSWWRAIERVGECLSAGALTRDEAIVGWRQLGLDPSEAELFADEFGPVVCKTCAPTPKPKPEPIPYPWDPTPFIPTSEAA